METIFIDTSIFVQENFLEGARINTILDLSTRGHIKLILSEITVNEIKTQFKKRATIAFDKHCEFINDKQKVLNVDVLRNNPVGKTIIRRLPAIKSICEDFNTLLDERLNSAKALILPYPTLNIAEVFNKYFSSKPPFGGGDKKHEFPDAFAFAHLEQWCAEKKRTVTFLTKDKDFSKLSHRKITVVNDLEKFIDERLKALTEEKRLKRLDYLYNINSDRINKEFETWVEEQFDDDSVFDDATNWLEINEKTINEVKVVSKEFELIRSDDENLEIEVSAIVSYKVTLNIPDENTGIYDHEDGVMLFRENIDIEVEQDDLTVPMKINFYIVNDEDFDTEYEVLSINDDKDIEIRPDGYNDYYN